MSGLNVEFQEAEPSRVMHLGCVVDRGRIERLRRDIFSCRGCLWEWGIWVVKETWWPGCMGEALKFSVVENGLTARVLVDSWAR